MHTSEIWRTNKTCLTLLLCTEQSRLYLAWNNMSLLLSDNQSLCYKFLILFLKNNWNDHKQTTAFRCLLFFIWTPTRLQMRLHEISNNVVGGTSKASDQPAHKRSLIRAFACRLNILWVLIYWFNIIWSFYAKKVAAHARLSVHLSKCHIVGNYVSRLR